jgi:type IV pilus assembly protein PilM
LMVKGIVGLDIGLDTIRAVEIEDGAKARPTVVRYSEVAVPEGAVRSGEVREVNTVASAIRRLWSTGGFKSKRVVLGIGNQRVLARDLTVPKASLAQIRESLPFQVQDMLPVPVSEALLDFYPVSEAEGEHGTVVNGLLIAALKDSVTANVDAARKAGLVPVNVDLIPFAISRALVRGEYAETTVALVDVGANTTHVVAVAKGVPQFVRIIPAGGADVTRTLANRLEVAPEQAEAAKRARGLSGAPATSPADLIVAEVVNTATGELLNSLRNTLNYFNNTRPHDPVQVIVLSGGGAELTGFARALAESMLIAVIPADAFKSFDVAKTAGNIGMDTRPMTVALGLALGGAA